MSGPVGHCGDGAVGGGACPLSAVLDRLGADDVVATHCAGRLAYDARLAG
jgi:hypothetical protein